MRGPSRYQHTQEPRCLVGNVVAFGIPGQANPSIGGWWRVGFQQISQFWDHLVETHWKISEKICQTEFKRWNIAKRCRNGGNTRIGVSFWAPWAPHMDAGLPPKLAWPVAITLPWSREVRIGFPAAVSSVSISNSLYNTPSTLVQLNLAIPCLYFLARPKSMRYKMCDFLLPPIKKLSGLISRWMKSLECKYSILSWHPKAPPMVQCQFSCLSTLRSVSQAAKATHAPYQCQR